MTLEIQVLVKFMFLLLLTEIACTRMSLNLTDGIHIIQDLNRYTLLKTVTMSCKSGFSGTPVTSQCTDVNKWSLTPPICTGKILVSAIAMPKLVDGYIKTHHSAADPAGGTPGARPPKIGKNMIFWRKIVIFHTKSPKNFAPPSARRNFCKCVPPNWKSWIRPCH